MKKYVIEDQIHCETISESEDISDIIKELERLSHLPWNEDKNLAPCMSWEKCWREYEIIEYIIVQNNWTELNRERIFDINSSGIIFYKNPYYFK